MRTPSSTILIQYKLPQILSNQRYAILIIFLIGIALRITPEIVAYPNPIGYDVVNYYIPVITNFDQHWPTVSGQFPLYVSFLHFVKEITGLSAQSTVVAMAVLMFGIFSISIFLASRTLLKASVQSSIFMTIFVIFQISVLRNAWDLHRDIVALSATLLTFCLIVASSSNKNNNNNSNNTYERWLKRITSYIISKQHNNSDENNHNHQSTIYNSRKNYSSNFVTILIIASIIATSIVAVGTARLVGCLFCASIVINAVINRKNKHAIVYAVFTVILFTVLLITSVGTHYTLNHQVDQIANPPQDPDGVYSPRNLRMLFAVIDGILIIPGSYGFIKILRERKKIRQQKRSEQRPLNLNLLAVPLLISLIGSFSWIAFPYHDLLVADRWIYLFGIFLSLFAAYGIVVGLIQEHLMKQEEVGNNNNINTRKKNTIVSLLISGSVLGIFVVAGISYAVMPYKDPFFLLSKFRSRIEYFAPVTMQFNSMDVKDTSKLIDAITWINKNTEPGAIITGEKHWRGLMELYLQNGRTYVSLNPSDVKTYELNPKDEAHKLGDQKYAYLIYHDPALPNPFVIMKIETR